MPEAFPRQMRQHKYPIENDADSQSGGTERVIIMEPS